jgi:hypothetical protein
MVHQLAVNAHKAIAMQCACDSIQSIIVDRCPLDRCVMSPLVGDQHCSFTQGPWAVR